jgi:hypothetical protein
MTDYDFPPLVLEEWKPTLDTLHHYARALGAIRRALTPRQRHWAHVSLRVSATGLTTTPVPYRGRAFELALDLTTHRVVVTTNRGETWAERLHGQPLSAFWDHLNRALGAFGIEPRATRPDYADAPPVYDLAAVERYAHALFQVDLLLKQFQGELHGATSAVQFWTHNFDLAMLWFSGRLVPGEDPADEESADEQMNLGFSAGDAGLPEPYFYATAYPIPDRWVGSPLPPGAIWHTQGWTGAVLLYKTLVGAPAPNERLRTFWRTVQARGQDLMR